MDQVRVVSDASKTRISMDPSKQVDAKTAENAARKCSADDECSHEGDNQLGDESKDEMARKGAVGRRFAVVNLPGAVTAGAEQQS